MPEAPLTEVLLPVMLAAGGAMFVAQVASKRPELNHTENTMMSVGIVAAFAFLYLYFVVKHGLPGPKMAISSGLLYASFGLMIVTCLYTVRKRQRLLYGLIEIGVGVYILADTGVQTFAGTTSAPLISMVAAVYVVIRGVVNVVEWEDQRKEDRRQHEANGGPESNPVETEGDGGSHDR